MRKVTDVFDALRFWLQLKITFYGYGRGFMLAALLVGALYLGFGLLAGAMGTSIGHGGLINIAFMAGVLLTVNVFKDLHHPEKGTYILMIPGSLEEKYLAAFSVSALAFPLAVVLVMTAVSYVTGGLNTMIHGVPFEVFNPVTAGLGSTFGKYIAVHSLFFAGSIWFRRYALFKTIFVLWLFSIAVIPVFFITFKVFVMGDFNNFLQMFGSMQDDTFTGLNPKANPVYPYAKMVFSTVVPMLLYCSSYFRLRETEIKG